MREWEHARFGSISVSSRYAIDKSSLWAMQPMGSTCEGCDKTNSNAALSKQRRLISYPGTAAALRYNK